MNEYLENEYFLTRVKASELSGLPRHIVELSECPGGDGIGSSAEFYPAHGWAVVIRPTGEADDVRAPFR